MARRIAWEQVPGPWPPGVQCRHETMVAGWKVVSELVLTGTGVAYVRINGEVRSEPIHGSLTAARRIYRAVQKTIRPRQTVLPI